MEFFTREHRELDRPLLATMEVLGSQVGQFVARRQSEESVRASEARLRAMLESALDAVITMDSRGRVVGWNQAASAVFGYHPSEAVGRDMADLIVPPSLRQRHRSGLARLLDGARPTILDHRLELTGMRRDGTEFPVELTITRIALPGPPTFTGYIRDITDRVKGEQELRASRARLLEVADAERKRIQRNLHDGAQQRLTAVLLQLGRLADSGDDRRAARPAIDELALSLQEIRELAGGLHPPVLTERGLAAALAGACALRSGPGRAAGGPGRATGRARRGGCVLRRRRGRGQRPEARRRDGDRGAARTPRRRARGRGRRRRPGWSRPQGGGLRGLADRVEALGGTLLVDSPQGRGTRLTARIPLG